MVAVLLSGGFAWWLSSPNEPRPVNPVLQVQPEVRPIRAASPVADPEQVRRAYEEFGLVYANSGREGLTRFSQSCEESLRGDPRILDFCLAFDLFADSIRAELGPEPPGKAEARRVALVQSALPTADPDRRIAEVQRLMRVTSGVQTAATPTGPQASAPDPRVAQTAERAAAGPVRLAKAAPPPRTRSLAARTSAYNCSLRATPADRLICANPALRNEDQRMKQAYEKALAAGADPLEIDRGQAEWRAVRNAADDRAELSRLYARRISELNAAAEAAVNTPPS